MDIRIAQALLQFTFLIVGILFLDFPIGLLEIFLTITCSLLFQKLWDFKSKRSFNWMSALPSALSLLLLLRVTEIWLWPLAAAICVSSKFILRYKKVHIFNPSAFTLFFFLVLVKDYGWVSPGQWGQLGLFCFVLSSLGLFMVYKVPTMWVSISFISCFILLHFSRWFYLGDSFPILTHQFQNAGIWLFTFFMISDPRTAPLDKKAQLVFGMTIALFAYVLAAHYHVRASLFYAIIIVSLFTPLLRKIYSSGEFKWQQKLFLKA
jgi:hypothetical protein